MKQLLLHLHKPLVKATRFVAEPKRYKQWLSTGLLMVSLNVQAQTSGALSGAYTINSAATTGGTNFASFAEAARRLNTDGVSGPVTFTVSGGPYNEQFVLNVVAGASATNTITVNGGGSTIQSPASASRQRAVITLRGTDYVTINNLVINAAGGTYGCGIQLFDNADYNRITNNIINADIATTSMEFAGISVSGSESDIVATGNTGSNLTIQGNTISGGFYSIVLQGNTTTSNLGNVVNNNTLRDFYYYGIYAGYQEGTQFIGNDIARLLRTNSTTYTGLYVFGSSRGLAIEKNRLHDTFGGNPTATSSVYGIYLATTTSATATAPNYVINNVLYNLSGNNSQYGVYASFAAYSRIYNNTINSDDPTATTTQTTYGIYSTGANSEVKNNTVSITRAGAGTKYGLYYATNAPASDYNDIYVPTGNVGYYTAAYATLSDWKATTLAFDQNSVSAIPVFTNPAAGNLAPNNMRLNNVGTPLARVLDDITGAPRGTAPDIGAYEFAPVTIDVAPVALVAPVLAAICYSTAEALVVQVRNNGTAVLDFATNPATVTVAVTPPGGVAQTFTTTLNTGTLASGATQNITLASPLNMAAAGTYSFALTATATGDLNPANDILTPNSIRKVVAPVAGTLAPSTSLLCGSGSVTLTLSGSANGSIQWQQSTDNITFTDIVGATSATYTTPVLTSAAYFRARTGCNASTVLSNVATILVNNPQVLTATTPLAVCAGSSAMLAATGSAGTTLRYFDAATGGLALGTGASYTTPALTAARAYYVEAVLNQNTSVGAVDNTFASGGAANIARALVFTVNSPTMLNGVYVYPGVAGSAIIEYRNSAGTLLQSITATFANSDVGVKTYVPLAIPLQVGTGFRLILNTSSTATLFYNTTGTTYPFTSISNNVSITGQNFSTVTSNTYYFFFYDWQLTSECVSATRTAIQVNVTTVPAAITAAAQANGTVLLTANAVVGATYQFFRNGTAVGAASTTNTLLLASATLNGSYTVVVTSGGCASAPSPAVAVTITGTRTATLTGVSLALYPNPSLDGRLTLELTGPQAKPSQLEILNALGQVVQHSALATGTSQLNIGALATGVYLLRVQTEQGILTQRVVRE